MGERCEGCQTSSCFTPYPDDDPHKPGEMRGCFAEKSRSMTSGVLAERGNPHTKQKPEAGQFERAIAGETRADGSFMPYIAPGGSGGMSKKRFADNRREFERVRRRQITDPTVFQKESPS